MKKYLLILLILPGLFFTVSARDYTNYRVEVLGKGLWLIQAISGPQQSTIYLVEGTKKALVIDAASGQDGLTEVVKDLVGEKPVSLVLTHGHGDHSGGVKYYSEVYMHPGDSALLEAYTTVKKHYINDGFVFDLGGQLIEVISIPGHTPGSIALYNRKGRYMMTGDGIGSTSVWAHLSNDPLTVFLASCKKLEALKDKIDAIYVGHHEQEVTKLTPGYISDMRKAAEGVLNGTIESKPWEFRGRKAAQADYGVAKLIFNPEKLK